MQTLFEIAFWTFMSVAAVNFVLSVRMLILVHRSKNIHAWGEWWAWYPVRVKLGATKRWVWGRVVMRQWDHKKFFVYFNYIEPFEHVLNQASGPTTNAQ